MNQLLKQVLLICMCLFALIVQANTDSLSDAQVAQQFNDAGNYAKTGNYVKAVELFRLLAEQGYAQAQVNLGVMYYDGRGVSQDYKEALKLYQLAAEQGHALAQTMLGEMFEGGQGVPQDYTVALKWYRLAAEQGYARAQANLALMYGMGKGISQDNIQAHMWSNIASATENDGDEQKKYAELRDGTARLMTAKQISKAQELARKCTAKKFKGC